MSDFKEKDCLEKLARKGIRPTDLGVIEVKSNVGLATLAMLDFLGNHMNYKVVYRQSNE